MVKIAVITERESDFSRAMASIDGVDITYFTPEEAVDAKFSGFDAFCILGGVSEGALCLPHDAWIRLERCMRAGKRFFIEFCRNIGEGDYDRPVSTRDKRLIYLGAPLGRTETFDLLDDQCNEMIIPNHSLPESFPILVCSQFLRSHYRAPNKNEYWTHAESWALWEFCPNIRVSCIRMCNFEKARFAPVCKWREVIRHMMGWITGIFAPNITFRDTYFVLPAPRMKELDVHVKRSVRDALSWLDNSGLLIDNGRNGVYEGFSYIVTNDGEQLVDKNVRCDTCGEVASVYLMEHLRTGSGAMLARFQRLQNFLYREFQIKTGPCRGMIRKSSFFLSISTQDHTCRAIMPTLLHAYHTGSDAHLEDACAALDFLLDITGPDGLCGESVDSITLDRRGKSRRAKSTGDRNSAYFNGAYMAALLLAYKVTGNERYRQVGELGMQTLINIYPNSPRLISETSEICRTLLPAVYLYWVTGKAEHLDFVKRLIRDLNRFQHVSGAYLEWDTGYQAKNVTSLLAQNGDPIVDLSSSLNWLPMALSEAYRITGDVQFYKLWQNVARFFVSCQLHSDDPKINGAWSRAFDPDLKEVYGIFSYVGWRPWSLKSGWVLGEILAGLENGLIFKPEKEK